MAEDLPKAGDVIGVRYRIEALLGQGGMGAVFAAVNQATGRAVAIKWMLPGAARSQDAIARFLAEARATAKVEHPNVIQILDVGQDGDAPFLVMERLRGQSLADRLERGRMSVPEALEVLIASCKGVAEAHSEGIIHRDLKPDNIFLCEGKDGSKRPPKVLDFGISKLYDQEGGPALTQTGIAMGTPQYMSPEQLNAPPDADGRFDVYAMGIVGYEMLTGSPPYRGEGLFELVQQIASGNPTPIRALSPECPPDLEASVMRAMHVNRDVRHPTMRDMVADLEQVQARIRSGGPAPIPHTLAGAGHAAHSMPGALTPAPMHHPSTGGSTGPIGGGAWTPAAGYAGTSTAGYGGAPPGYGAPPSGPYAAPAASGGSSGLVLGLVAAAAGIGLLALVGLGAAFLVFGGDDDTSGTGGGGTTSGGGGGIAGLGGLGGAADPHAPQIDLTFSGGCAPTFDARVMVIGSAGSLSITSTTIGGITGSLQFSLNGATGAVPLSTRGRIDTQMVVNLMAGQSVFTNMSTDSAVLTNRADDPIGGTLVIHEYDEQGAIAHLEFQNAVLQHVQTGALCTVNGTLRTRGTTYGY